MNHINNKLYSLALGATLLALTPCAIASIVYDESVNGELDFFISPQTFNFTEGSNIILGSSALGDIFSPSDNFSFFLDSGYTLTSVTYNIFNVVAEGSIKNASLFFTVGTVDGTSTVFKPALDSDLITVLNGSTPDTSLRSLFNSALPLEEGLYGFQRTGTQYSGRGDTTDIVFWDYSIEFNVTNQNTSPVPLPAASYLFMTGLLSLIAFRRKANCA